ncbi:peptidoglycan-binding domain-containing protein [Streptomyces sp. CS081A]|uniref:peptidoglycan-binding domain-containing protein n=1 Tax=Streptomyces sp. CS081A TaxID=2162709 RepID=UPI000D50936F|nr:peptidoglycan-binding domain-containing protein [Streptomyces sp. CS081A]PVC71921.1 peptidoglycan-binding protein [Streptomyces sp. CS081A]
MTGHVCPECGVHRPGCACARAELAAAEDFDPLRIRPYVTLDAPKEAGAHGAGSYAYGTGAGTYGAGAHGAGGADADPPTARPAAVHPEEYPYGTGGDPSETMPLLLRGVGEVPPPPGGGRPRGRRRGAAIAAAAAVAVAGTAALAATALGGADRPDDRAAVPEVTTSASLNLAVSEEPSPSSGSPGPTSSSPAPRRTSASPSASPSASASHSASASGTTASPGASSGSAAPPSVTTSASPTTAPSATSATPSRGPEETEEPDQEAVTLSYGDQGPEVEDLQWRLRAAWVYFGPVDGRYGNKVREAVREFQRWRSIQGDPMGVYGPSTREVLEREQPGI